MEFKGRYSIHNLCPWKINAIVKFWELKRPREYLIYFLCDYANHDSTLRNIGLRVLFLTIKYAKYAYDKLFVP